INRPQSKECIEDRLTGSVQPILQIVQELVQAVTNDFFHLNVIQLRTNPAQPLFRLVPEGAARRTGDGAQRFLRFDHAMVDRPRELTIENQKLHNTLGRNLLMRLPVHLECARRTENGAPQNIVIRTTNVTDTRQEHEVLHVEKPRSLIRTLEHSSNMA